MLRLQGLMLMLRPLFWFVFDYNKYHNARPAQLNRCKVSQPYPWHRRGHFTKIKTYQKTKSTYLWTHQGYPRTLLHQPLFLLIRLLSCFYFKPFKKLIPIDTGKVAVNRYITKCGNKSVTTELIAKLISVMFFK